MPKCPKCEKEIDYLGYECEEVSTYAVSLSPNRERLEWERVDSETVEESDTYTCPECGAEIAHHYSEAVAFLKGEKA
jgi:ribosomal protein S27AE